ncbi:hypothetical protein Salat_0577700 [Sesamum alatum]|uniref:SWIM-type domain-containing protein n=1 Tax=Sesamum alatum TaxID=300844 RepID=A0AAE2CTP3_9LAMI|nr:hypothetical protein Salat_0577700 [Sesamum alatum]
MKFSLEINFLGQKCIVTNLESADYNYISLLNDVCGAAIGERTTWLSALVVVEGVLPDTGDVITITSDEDINSLIAIYLSIGLDSIIVNLHIFASTSQVPEHEDNENLITVLGGNETNEEEIEIEEINNWSDSENEATELHVISDEDNEDNLSDYNSDNDQSPCDNQNRMTALSEKMEGAYFDFKYDDCGNQIIDLHEGIIFDNVQHFKEILTRYSVQEGIKVKKVKNDKQRVTAVCNNSDQCTWRLHASTYGGVIFKIKNITGVHTCVRNLKGSGASAKWIANQFKDEYKFNPEKSVEELDSALRSKFGVHAYSKTCKEPPNAWSRHGFDVSVKVDHVTNNMTESFNAFLGKMRQRPVIHLIEWYRTKVMKRFFTRYQKALAWQTKLPPNVNARVERNQRAERKLLVIPSSEYLFEVSDDRKYIVNLKELTCQCREWQVSGIPCKHAMGCILYMRLDPVQFVDEHLTTEAYLRTYKGKIQTVPDESIWPENPHIPPLKPPIHKKKNKAFKQGPLQVNRRKEPNELPKVHKRSIHKTCKACNGIGHNKRTCKSNSSQSMPSQVLFV